MLIELMMLMTKQSPYILLFSDEGTMNAGTNMILLMLADGSAQSLAIPRYQ